MRIKTSMNNTTETVNTTAQMINQEGLGTVILALFIVVFAVYAMETS